MSPAKFFWFFGWIFIIGCASIKYPEGGPKDETLPALQSVKPNFPKTHFKEKAIEVKFSEYIKNEDYTKEIIFSPPLNPPAKVLTYGKKIKIILPKTLSPEYTYLLTVNKNIKDFSEGNPLDTIYQFPFTKSDKLDSCQVYGQLLVAHPKMKIEDFWIFLYPADSIPNLNFQNKTSFYLAKANENYSYRLSYLKPGRYKILAVQDKNHDFQYTEGENIGIAENMDLDLINHPSHELDLVCFPNDTQPPKIKKSYWKDSLTYAIEFTEPYLKDSLKLHLNFSSQYLLLDQKVEIYFPHFTNDTLRMQLHHLLDTLGNRADTTLLFTLNKTRSPEKKYKISEPEIHPEYWIFKSNVPLNPQHSDKIYVLDTSNQNITLPIKIQENFIKIETRGVHDSLFYLVKIDSTFLSYQSQSLDSSLTFKIKPVSEEDYYGYLKLTFQCEYENFLGILRNVKTDEKRIFREKEIVLDRLPKGKYQIIVINDLDNNQLWTTGNLQRQQLPEEIFIYPEELEIKPKMKIENLTIQVE